MSNHSTSTELLQEIRQMVTQLKSYLLQSTELQAMLEPQHQYAQDKLGKCFIFVSLKCAGQIYAAESNGHLLFPQDLPVQPSLPPPSPLFLLFFPLPSPDCICRTQFFHRALDIFFSHVCASFFYVRILFAAFMARPRP